LDNTQDLLLHHHQTEEGGKAEYKRDSLVDVTRAFFCFQDYGVMGLGFIFREQKKIFFLPDKISI
jgi:hypothetical protein